MDLHQVTAVVKNVPTDSVENTQKEDVKTAGATLVKLANRDSSHILLNDDRDLIERCIKIGGDDDHFSHCHLNAIDAAATSWNLDLLTILMDRDCSGLSWASKPGILQRTIDLQLHSRKSYGNLLDIAQLLIRHGVVINSFDSHGNTALYFACTYGLREIFELLLRSGASTTTEHISPNVNEHGVTISMADRQISDSTKVNLLQITLNALWISSTIQNDCASAYERWGNIIMKLIDLGLTASLDDPALSNFLELACRERKLEAVKRVLGTGIYPDAGLDGAEGRSYSLAPALHAAVENGDGEAVAYLLDAGANPRTKCQHYAPPFRWDLPVGNKTAIAAFCGSGRKGRPLSSAHRPAEVLDACELLFNSGVDEDDQFRFLKEAVRQGRVHMISKCLRRGVHLTKAPLTRSLEALQMVYQDGSTVDWTASQKYAVYIRDVAMMKWLVSEGGPCLVSQSDFDGNLFPSSEIPMELAYLHQDWPSDVLEQRRLEMIQYLVSEYGVNSPNQRELQAMVQDLFLRSAIYDSDREVL